MRSLGYKDPQIRRLLNRYYFMPLSQLDKYQDSGTIRIGRIDRDENIGVNTQK